MESIIPGEEMIDLGTFVLQSNRGFRAARTVTADGSFSVEGLA
jgi:hypothetical protein